MIRPGLRWDWDLTPLLQTPLWREGEVEGRQGREGRIKKEGRSQLGGGKLTLKLENQTSLTALTFNLKSATSVNNNNNNNNNNSKTMFMVLSSWPSHCESSPGSFYECRTAPSGQRPKTKPNDLGCESACTSCQSLHPLIYSCHRRQLYQFVILQLLELEIKAVM